VSWANFRTFIEESVGRTQLPILYVNAYSSGRHAYDLDDEEIPASHPKADDDAWELDIVEAAAENFHEVEQLLMGRWSFVEEGGFASYHEWQIWASVNVILNAELEAAIEDLLVKKNIISVEPYDKKAYVRSQRDGGVFKYAGLKDAIIRTGEVTGLGAPDKFNIPLPPPKTPKIKRPKPGESSEKWWHDLSNPPGKPPTRYGPRGWETGWDGD